MSVVSWRGQPIFYNKSSPCRGKLGKDKYPERLINDVSSALKKLKATVLAHAL